MNIIIEYLSNKYQFNIDISPLSVLISPLYINLPSNTNSCGNSVTWFIGLFSDISSPAYPPGRIVSELPNNTRATAAAHSSPAPSLNVTPERWMKFTQIQIVGYWNSWKPVVVSFHFVSGVCFQHFANISRLNTSSSLLLIDGCKCMHMDVYKYIYLYICHFLSLTLTLSTLTERSYWVSKCLRKCYEFPLICDNLAANPLVHHWLLIGCCYFKLDTILYLPFLHF